MWKHVKISGYMHKFQELTPISGHFRTNFKISGQRPGLCLCTLTTQPRWYGSCNTDNTYRFSSIQDDCKIIFPPRIETFTDHNFMTHRPRLTRLLRKDSTINHLCRDRPSFVSTVQNTTHYVTSLATCPPTQQAGSRRGSRRAMLRTYAWLKLLRTDRWTHRWTDRHCATIRASLACAPRANKKQDYGMEMKIR